MRPPVPGNGRGRAPRYRRPGPDQQYTATYGSTILPGGDDRHCERCRCRCDCHRPPPEPAYTPWPATPKPGEPFYMAAIAASEVEVEVEEWAA